MSLMIVLMLQSFPDWGGVEECVLWLYVAQQKRNALKMNLNNESFHRGAKLGNNSFGCFGPKFSRTNKRFR
jgi:hypothetical protein